MKKALLVGVAFVLVSLETMAGPKNLANGKFLFKDWGCKSCHSIGSQYNQDATK